MNHPVLLLISNDSKTPAEDVIAKIRKIPNNENILESDERKFYIHDISTKYYKTQIAFLPADGVDELDQSTKDQLEGILIYFDSKDRSVLEKLPRYVELIKEQNIEFCMMLCKELSEDEKTGVTFKCIKDCYNMLDIIELEKSSQEDEEDDESDDPFNPSGYDELAQALRSVIWSNVDVGHVSMSGKPQVSNGSDNNVDEHNEINVESELESFEKLLNQVMQFRPATSNMSREDRLNCAQGFAEVFEKLIMQDEDLNDLDVD